MNRYHKLKACKCQYNSENRPFPTIFTIKPKIQNFALTWVCSTSTKWSVEKISGSSVSSDDQYFVMLSPFVFYLLLENKNHLKIPKFHGYSIYYLCFVSRWACAGTWVCEGPAPGAQTARSRTQRQSSNVTVSARAKLLKRRLADPLPHSAPGYTPPQLSPTPLQRASCGTSTKVRSRLQKQTKIC